MEPKKLAIYYGWPSSVNATWTVAGAAGVFKAYYLVVFGAGLEDSLHGDHQNTDDIINHADMTNTEVYGYIDSTASQNTIETSIDNWNAMGVAGIFCDQFGYDFGVKRSEQNNIVDYIHTVSLKAFVNAWDVDDAFSSAAEQPHNPSGTAHKLNTTDWYLAESYQIINGGYQTASAWETKSDKMVTYQSDCQMACVTTYDNSAFSQGKADYSYYSCAMYGFGAWGWGEENFSASSASLTFRTRKMLPEGVKLDGAISDSNEKYERNTNVGFHVDTGDHTVSDRLD